MEYLDQAELDLGILEYKQAELTEIQNDQKQIKDLVHKYSRCSETLNEVSVKAGAVDALNQLTLDYKEFAHLNLRIAQLTKIIQNYERTDSSIPKLESIAGAMENLSTIGDKMDRLAQIQDQIAELKKTWESWTSTDDAFRTKQTEGERLRNKIADMMPETCPLCEQEVR